MRLTITGTGNESREFVYLADVVMETLLTLSTERSNGQIVHVGSGRSGTIRELAEALIAMTRSRSAIQYLPRRPWDTITSRVTICSKAQELLGDARIVDFDTRLTCAIDWIRASLGR